MAEGKIYLSIEENSIVPPPPYGVAYYTTTNSLKSSPASNLKNGNVLASGWVMDQIEFP